MKVAAGAVWHETLGFAHTRTELEAFSRFQLTEGAQIIERNLAVRNEMGGFLSAAASLGMDVVPTLFAGALPSPTISSSAWEYIRRRLLDRIASALPIDGVFLALHGAATVEGSDDPEADLLADIRQAVGNIPIVVTVDLHANVSERLFQLADVLVAYDTYPHVDIFDRGAEAAHVLQKLLRGERITGAFRKLPLLTAPQVQGTDDEPVRSVMSCVHAAEESDRVLTVSVCPGYPYSDVPRLGAAVFVYTIDDGALADRIAGDIAQLLWNRRDQFCSPAISVSQAVARAIASVDFPVILVDSADNIGGGTPGDGTAILAELLVQKAQAAVVTIADAKAAATCFEHRPGDSVRLPAGAQYDKNHGTPVLLEGHVRLLSDGVYHHAGSYMTGIRVDMGRTAVIVCGGVEVVLMEHKAMPFDAEQLRCVGIEPSRKRIVAVKSAIAWKAAYGELARRIIQVDTPGLCSGNLHSFSYKRRPHPLYPFEDFDYRA